tara:strand:+ start:175 stop:936 length:762 start_codon:yes stop_codon:yes gene_type:complete
MNELQNAIKKSFRTSSHRVEEFIDPDGVRHPAHLVHELPYCASMKELAIKFDLSVSQTYRMMKEPHRRWSKLALEELHKQLHWPERYPWDDSIRVPIAETQALIRRSAAYERTRSIAANNQRQKHDPANPDNQITFTMPEGIEKFLDGQRQQTDKVDQFFKQQEELVKRLLDLNERQQDLIEKLTGQIAESSAKKTLDHRTDDVEETLQRFMESFRSSETFDSKNSELRETVQRFLEEFEQSVEAEHPEEEVA